MQGGDDLFPGFAAGISRGEGVDIFYRIGGGKGPPLLLLHGYPQTHAMWHTVAGDLARHFTVVVADLRGYGRSSAPEGDADHQLYSKRAMAATWSRSWPGSATTASWSPATTAAGGSATGWRSITPDKVRRLAVLDILPTYDYWQNMDWRYGMAIYHWLFLAQPKPLPERLISGAPDFYLDHTLASWTARKDLSAFDPRALADYRASFAQPARQHAACEDYRAGATIDMALDSADREAGRKIACPLLTLYGNGGLAQKTATPVETWSRWANDVRGHGVDAGHFLPEEAPAATLAALLPFFLGEA